MQRFERGEIRVSLKIQETTEDIASEMVFSR